MDQGDRAPGPELPVLAAVRVVLLRHGRRADPGPDPVLNSHLLLCSLFSRCAHCKLCETEVKFGEIVGYLKIKRVMTQGSCSGSSREFI